MVEPNDEERGDVRPRPAMVLRTEYTVGALSRADGWHVAIDYDGKPVWMSGPFTSEEEARSSALARLAVVQDLADEGELLREESVPPEASER